MGQYLSDIFEQSIRSLTNTNPNCGKYDIALNKEIRHILRKVKLPVYQKKTLRSFIKDLNVKPNNRRLPTERKLKHLKKLTRYAKITARANVRESTVPNSFI